MNMVGESAMEYKSIVKLYKRKEQSMYVEYHDGNGSSNYYLKPDLNRLSWMLGLTDGMLTRVKNVKCAIPKILECLSCHSPICKVWQGEDNTDANGEELMGKWVFWMSRRELKENESVIRNYGNCES